MFISSNLCLFCVSRICWYFSLDETSFSIRVIGGSKSNHLPVSPAKILKYSSCFSNFSAYFLASSNVGNAPLNLTARTLQFIIPSGDINDNKQYFCASITGSAVKLDASTTVYLDKSSFFSNSSSDEVSTLLKKLLLIVIFYIYIFYRYEITHIKISNLDQNKFVTKWILVLSFLFDFLII